MAASASAPLAPGSLVGVVGAGAMGAGIAQVAALAGHPVRLFDTRPTAADQTIATMLPTLAKLAAKGRITAAQAAFVSRELRPAASLSDLAPCALVVEAIVEDLTAKQALFAALETCLSPTAILASNSSSLSITAIAAKLQHPERVAGMHFFNPAPLMPLVEVISGAATAPHIAQTLHATAAAWGKTPVYARSTPGFIVNRVARPFYSEALRLLNEGAADCATIDAVLREAGGFRMGPFELMDLIGHDVNYAVTCSVFHAFYGDPRFTPSLRQLELVEAGFLGRKTGRGFYRYDETASQPQPLTHPPVSAPGAVHLFGSQSVVERLAIATCPIHRHDAHPDGRLAECGPAVLYASDGRTASTRAAATGIPETLLLDLCLDPAATPRIALSAADSSSQQARDAIVGLLQSAGFCVSLIDDAPGLIVLRTVAMLANEAADAVYQGVTNAADCDLAMRKGVNYPLGPLAWADRLGLPEVVAVLDHLAAWYGEDRYRTSPLLRRRALAGKPLQQLALTRERES